MEDKIIRASPTKNTNINNSRCSNLPIKYRVVNNSMDSSSKESTTMKAFLHSHREEKSTVIIKYNNIISFIALKLSVFAQLISN